jgi:energy-coupling factor transporter ATP-binding protein EcfA2
MKNIYQHLKITLRPDPQLIQLTTIFTSNIMPLELDLKDTFMLIIGRRGSGKSVMLKWILTQQKHHFKETFIFSPSSFSGYWKDTVPDENVQLDYSEDWIDKLVTKMTGLNQGKNQQSPDFVRVLLVLDDVISSCPKSQTSNCLKLLSTRGRHLGISCIISSQHVNFGQIGRVLRENSDYTLISKLNRSSLEIVEDVYNTTSMSKDKFLKFIAANTNDHRFLVICSKASSNKREDTFGVLRAPYKS